MTKPSVHCKLWCRRLFKLAMVFVLELIIRIRVWIIRVGVWVVRVRIRS